MLQRLDSTMPGQGQHLISFALPQATPRPSPPPPPLYHSIHTPQQLANQTNPTHNSHDAVDQANQHKYQKYKSQIESKSKEGGTQETPSAPRSYCLWNLHNTKLNLTTELPKRRQSQSRIERATKKNKNSHRKCKKFDMPARFGYCATSSALPPSSAFFQHPSSCLCLDIYSMLRFIDLFRRRRLVD